MQPKTKWCNKCKQDKPVAEFSKNKTAPDGLSNQCKACAKAKHDKYWAENHERLITRASEYRKVNREKICRKARERVYGVSWAEIEAKYNAQEGKCAICGKFSPLEGRGCMAIDHEHKTGKVRDLLCFPCNSMIGHAGENQLVLQKAIAYLQRHEGENP